MTFPVSHKTIFVLDHSTYFLESCRQQMDFDVFTQKRQPGIIPLAPISKSLWTCSVEGAVEYCRIVWDIYPRNRLIRFIVSDKTAKTLNTWNVEDQNVPLLMAQLANLGPPSISMLMKDCDIMHGLSAAIEALCECSDVQHEKRTSLTESASKVMNRGRIICVTHLKSDQYAKSLEECFLDSIIQHNKLAASTDNLIPIHFCELVLIHTHPTEVPSIIADKPRREISPLLSTEIHSLKAGRHLPTKICQLVLRHYNLASTTVTGIPMKEEQNANSSANYDVELLHPCEAHTELVKSGCSGTMEGIPIRALKEGAEYETVTLKWCTPRTSSIAELQYCTNMFRITPMDVNSRPSSCLTNFLLNGRAVMLEMPRKSGTKVMSHMLASHGGEIFIHTLGTTRSILEDPPSISEGCGGRVTDYRINDFGEFMKSSKLVPYKKPVRDGDPQPIENAKRHLERLTRYWPTVISNTTIFNMAHVLEPLLSLIVKEKLSNEDVFECNKVIYELVGMDSRNDALPIPSMGTRGKGPKREEQYRVLWNELETLVKAHCDTDEHLKVLECLRTCHKPFLEVTTKVTSTSPGSLTLTLSSTRKGGDKTPVKEEKNGKAGETELAWKELDKYSKMTEREKSDFNSNLDPFEAAKSKRTESPPIKKMKTSMKDTKGKATGPRSLLNIWTSRINAEHAKRHTDFAGRISAEGSVAKLYASLAENQEGSSD